MLRQKKVWFFGIILSLTCSVGSLIAMYFMPPMDQKERKKILDIVKSLSLGAYKSMTKNDPTGEKHVQRFDIPENACMTVLEEDGRPLVKVSYRFFDNFTPEEIRAILAHELAHYALGHLGEPNRPFHKSLTTSDALVEEYFKMEAISNEFAKGKRVAGQLPTQETLKRAFRRTEEDEADKVSVVDFDVSIDDAISALKKIQKISNELRLQHPEKETFKITHKLASDRIAHFEQLRRDVELKKAAKKDFNWEVLAKEYKQKFANAKVATQSKKLSDTIQDISDACLGTRTMNQIPAADYQMLDIKPDNRLTRHYNALSKQDKSILYEVVKKRSNCIVTVGKGAILDDFKNACIDIRKMNVTPENLTQDLDITGEHRLNKHYNNFSDDDKYKVQNIMQKYKCRLVTE